jgi:predicted nucleic-acid-binding protein
MLAIDTNVVVRYLAADDPAQSKSARKLIDDETVFIPLSVLLETEWVLRSVYAFDRSSIAAAVRTLAGQPTVTLENPGAVRQALGWFEQGMDLADALHIAASQACDAFISFDTELTKIAKRLDVLTVRRP